MARKNFLYYLISQNKFPLYRDKATGHILEADADYKKPNSQPAHLIYSPDGWKDTLVKFARNLKYRGIFRDMTVPMKFYGDGADILTDQMWKDDGGSEQLTYLLMEKLDRMNLPYRYKNWYLSEINYSKFQQTKNGVEVQAMEGGLSKYLKSNESTQYDIPIDSDTEMAQLYHDGLTIDNSASFMIENDVTITTDALQNHLVGIQLTQKEITTFGDVPDSITRTKVINNNTNIKATGDYIFKATVPGLITCDWDFTLDVTFVPPPALNPGATLDCILRVIKPNGTSTQILTILHRSGGAIDGSYVLKGSGTLNLAVNDEVYFYTFVSPTGSTGDAQTYFNYSGNSLIKLTYSYKFPPTTVNGLLPLTVAKRLVDKMTGTTGVYNIQSTFLTQRNLDIMLFSGDSLRQLHPASLHTSFSDFFQSFDSDYCIGLGIKGNTLIIEELPYFFRNDLTLFDIGELSEWNIDVAEDMIYSSANFGIKKIEYQGINGKYEFNQGQRWKFPINKMNTPWDRLSIYRKDPYGIELYRLNYDQKTTTDSTNDNDTFMINVVRTINQQTMVATKKGKQTGTLPITVQYDSVAGVLFTPNSTNSEFTFTGIGAQYVNIQLFFEVDKGDGSSANIQILRNNVDVLASKHFVANGGADGTAALGVILQPGDVIKIVVQYDGTGSVNATVLQSTLTVYFPNIYVYNIYRPLYTSITGVPHPEDIYNTELTPKHSLLRNGALIHSFLDRRENNIIEFTDGDKNVDLSTTLNGVTILEKANVPVSSLPAKLFLPYYITGKTQVPMEYKAIMDANPYGRIGFTINGNQYFGFVFDSGVKPGTNDVQQWQFISCPDNDFKKIKRGQ